MAKRSKAKLRPAPLTVKQHITNLIITEMGWSTTTPIAKHYAAIWQDTRTNIPNGFQLTKDGFKLLSETLQFKRYAIAIPHGFIFTNQVMVWLAKYIECPFYISHHYRNYNQPDKIEVFGESMAVQLILFGGDLGLFGRAKEISAKTPEPTT